MTHLLQLSGDKSHVLGNILTSAKVLCLAVCQPSYKFMMLADLCVPLGVQAACCIVSHRATQDFDAYVLSESSLFVYPERLMLKTCGTTQLLAAVPLLLELAGSLSMHACCTKYSRASFLFPEKQVSIACSPFRAYIVCFFCNWQA